MILMYAFTVQFFIRLLSSNSFQTEERFFGRWLLGLAICFEVPYAFPEMTSKWGFDLVPYQQGIIYFISLTVLTPISFLIAKMALVNKKQHNIRNEFKFNTLLPYAITLISLLSTGLGITSALSSGLSSIIDARQWEVNFGFNSVNTYFYYLHFLAFVLIFDIFDRPEKYNLRYSKKMLKVVLFILVTASLAQGIKTHFTHIFSVIIAIYIGRSLDVKLIVSIIFFTIITVGFFEFIRGSAEGIYSYIFFGLHSYFKLLSENDLFIILNLNGIASLLLPWSYIVQMENSLIGDGFIFNQSYNTFSGFLPVSLAVGFLAIFIIPIFIFVYLYVNNKIKFAIKYNDYLILIYLRAWMQVSLILFFFSYQFNSLKFWWSFLFLIFMIIFFRLINKLAFVAVKK